MARDLGTLKYIIDVEEGGVDAKLAAFEAKLKSIPDEQVKLTIDTKVENVRETRATLMSFKKLLSAAGKAGAFDDKRLKVYRDLPQKLKDIVNAHEDWTDALATLNYAFENNGAWLASTTQKQREYSEAVNRSAKATRDEDKGVLELSKTREKYAKIMREITRRERSPLALNTEVETRELDRLKAEAEQLSRRFQILGGDTDKLNYKFDEQNSRLTKAIAGMGDLRLHLGFFSMSVKQLAMSLGILGPVVSGVLGALGGLIGTLGVSFVAAVGLAGGALAGFGLIATGVGLAIAPLFKELGAATKAATDYQKQVLKTGVNSSEAKDKLDAYHQTVKNLPADTQKLVAQSGVLYTRWTQLTSAFRKPFFEIAGYGIQALTRIMPVFAAETQRAFKFVTGASRELLQGFGRAESRSIIQVLMRQTGKAVPALVSGIGSIVTAFARLSAASVRFLPKAATAFSSWAQGIADMTNQNGFQGTVNGMMAQLKSLGQLASATGRLLITFFSAGASSGQTLVQSITGVFNRWNSWMKSVEGQKALTSFFENGVKEIGLLYNAITPFLKIFARWSEALRPFSQMLLEIIGAFGDLIEPVTRWKLALQGLALLSVISTAISLTAALGALGKGFAIVAANSRIAAAALALLRVGSMTGGIKGIMQMAASSRNLYVALGVLATYGLYKVIHGLSSVQTTTERVNASIRESENAFKRYNSTLVDLQNDTVDLTSAKEHSLDAWKRVNDLAKAGMQGTNEYSAAIRDAAAAEREQKAAQDRRIQAATQAIHTRRAEIEAAVEAVKTAKAARAAESGVGGRAGQGAAALRQATSGTTSLAKATEHLREVLGRQTLEQTNYNRALKGFVQLAGPQVSRVMGQFKAAFGKGLLKQRVTLEEDPRLAVKIAGYAAKLKELGKTKEAKVVLKSDRSNQQVAKELGRMLGDKKREVKAEFSLTGDPKKKIAQLKKDLNDLEKGRAINLETSRARDRLQDVKREAENLFDGVEYQGPTYRAKVIEPPGSGGPGSAQGGSAKYFDNQMRGSKTQGGRYSQPSFLVGEENRPEYVIATNPSYRQNNIKYWMQAGHALGIPGFADGGMRGKPPKKPTATGNSIPAPPGNWHKAGYDKLKNFFIPWSENETDATARIQERLLNQGISKDYPAQIKDIDRSIAMYKRLQRLLNKKMQGKKDIIKDKKTGKDKRKQAKSDLNDMKQEYFVDNRQALSNLRLDRAELKAESTTGSGFAVNPFLTEMLTYTQSQYQLGQQYGSNMLGGAAAISGANVTAAGGTPSTRSGGPGAAGGRSVTITNNYQEPPADPHTWSKQLAWEVGVG